MLSDAERDAIQSLLTNEVNLRILRKVFEFTISQNNPLVTDTDSNTLLGEKYRAFQTSKDIVDSGFKNLESYKITPKSKDAVNRAR